MSRTQPLSVHVLGVGLLGPGLPDWSTGRGLLRDPAMWVCAPTVLAPPMRLPSAERRRAGAVVKLSLAVAEQACAQAGIDPHMLATVFTASTGDAANCHALCEALASPERVISPTRFTNSVHNAAAGYWHIATTSRAASTSLCGHDATFGAGLLEAVSQCAAGQRPVLLVAGDVPYPEPLHSVRPLLDAFALALVLAPSTGDACLGRLDLQLVDETPGRCDHAGLDALRTGVPAARGLPLLQALARAGRHSPVIEYLDGMALKLDVDVS